jgi:hypothetical protein
VAQKAVAHDWDEHGNGRHDRRGSLHGPRSRRRDHRSLVQLGRFSPAHRPPPMAIVLT